jgi:hypothetical protein
MAPFDAHNPYAGEDPVKMLRAMTMAFMVFLSKQPHMAFTLPVEVIEEFPYDDYRLSAMSDPDGTQTFLLIREDDAGTVH